VTEPADETRCPDCGSGSGVVTAVTVPGLGDAPRTVLVARQCSAEDCLLKFPIFKIEHALTDDERAAWKRR